MKHVKIRVHGKVQGVYFRASTMDTALELGITGFVRNEPDGSVYIEAEGSPEAVEGLIIWCNTGPPRARVEKVEITEGDPVHFGRFELRR